MVLNLLGMRNSELFIDCAAGIYQTLRIRAESTAKPGLGASCRVSPSSSSLEASLEKIEF